MAFISRLSYKVLASVLGATAILSAAQAFAQISKPNHEGWYQVELIVFARKDDSGQEHWPNNIKLRYPGDWVELKDPADTSPVTGLPSNDTTMNNATSTNQTSIDLTKEPFYLLPASDRNLNAQAQKLQRNPNFEVLFHNAWRQVITNKKSSKAIIINGGQTFGEHQSLEGSIRLSVATYLELQTNLWLAQYDLNVGQEITQQWPEIPKRPNYANTNLSTLSLDSELELDQALATENAAWANGNFDPNTSAPEVTDTYVTRQIILLQQERDMRSNEVHYIDHPVLGLIIQITPYSSASASTSSQ
ncbi:CsiV family protein [Cellvibrio sp. UBA7661]|uniref:CsiV family protein n=1 Tax=Cellvibrio sp. UBA7661 TaxID=1946311 RepID=UPI002F358872